jgi:hypothetical protein
MATPLGIPVWLLYGVPILLLRADTPRQHVYALAGACTILIFAGYLLSSSSQLEPIMERFGAAIIVWFVAIMFRRPKRPANEA